MGRVAAGPAMGVAGRVGVGMAAGFDTADVAAVVTLLEAGTAGAAGRTIGGLVEAVGGRANGTAG